MTGHIEHFEQTQFGFEWQAAKVTRLFSDPQRGWVTLGIKTPREDLQIYITKTGKIRVYGKTGEWAKPKKK